MGPGMEYPGYAMSDGFVATPSELLAGDPFRYFVLNAAAYEPYDSNTLAGFSADQRGGALFLQASFYDPRNGYVSHHSQLSTPGLAFAHAVPEPATWAMMIVGFGMIGGAIRHRKRRPAFSAPRFV
ncbi:MAG: PEPxxWA-CTERM sorting domain-containing protein [Sphingomonas sp.]|nr:PEPxxWA-CTERM sorting domain-containing protein [Sphingomonas sp.]